MEETSPIRAEIFSPKHPPCDNTSTQDYEMESDGHRCNGGDRHSRDESECTRRREKVKWSQVWFDFTQETSFHGVRQVVEPQPFIIRRLLWLILFLAGTVVFLLQVGFSIRYYLAWPVSVDVKINYNKTITFPAITICNENTFRATKAYDLGHYQLITDLFTRQHSADTNVQHASKLSLEQLYLETKHRKQDLIFKCEWDGIECSHDDFTTTLTDFGVCFTFNGLHNDRRPRKVATQTGAQGGLRLQLNIEQYEYMSGPNDGAGVKLLVHQQHDVPLVKDHGLAVPAGMHAFVALDIIEVHNLKPPHGKCNDSVLLEHFHDYTMSTCALNCKQRHLVAQCGCRDIYMPDHTNNNSNKEPPSSSLSYQHIPVCDLQTFQRCMRKQLDSFHQKENTCECPVPCKRVSFKPTVSYVSTSNFDIGKLLNSNVTDTLKKRYVRGREVSQRTNANSVKKHNALVHNVHTMVESIDEVFQQVTTTIKEARLQLERMVEKMTSRIKFHLRNGLNHVQFVMEHDFIRGWEVYEERVLNFVSSDYLNVAESVQRTIEWINRTTPLDKGTSISDRQSRRSVWWPMRNELEGRLMLVNLARINVTTAHTAYKTGTPILTFVTTLNRRYDMSYVSLELLKKGTSRQNEYFGDLMGNLNRMAKALHWMLDIGEKFIVNDTYSAEEFLAAKNLYIRENQGYNYRHFLFKERIIMKPMKYIEKRMKKFVDTNETFINAYANLKTGMDIVTDLVKSMNVSQWRSVHSIVSQALEYEHDERKTKTHLALLGTSSRMAEDIRQLKLQFVTTRSRAQELSDNWRSLSEAYQQMWRNIVSETSTQQFYEMIHEDTEAYLHNRSDILNRAFADLLKISTTKMWKHKPEDLSYLLNSDFSTLDLADKLEEVQQYFRQLESSCEVSSLLGDKDEVFMQNFENLQNSLQQFLAGNVINEQFYRENFLHLDVFMQELSYEEITQQPAYDLPQLLGDIGGSMGLFIGGSALSVFEFFDVIFHNGARLLFHR